MISHIFYRKHGALQSIAEQSKSPYESACKMVMEIVRAFNSQQIFDWDADIETDYVNAYYDFVIDNDTIYFEGIDKDSVICEVVALDLKTGKYTMVDIDEYCERYWADEEC